MVHLAVPGGAGHRQRRVETNERHFVAAAEVQLLCTQGDFGGPADAALGGRRGARVRFAASRVVVGRLARLLIVTAVCWDLATRSAFDAARGALNYITGRTPEKSRYLSRPIADSDARQLGIPEGTDVAPPGALMDLSRPAWVQRAVDESRCGWP
eukprot:COSAG02_NODE_21002_length_806_cov_2.057992_1_plen_154_part_10